MHYFHRVHDEIYLPLSFLNVFTKYSIFFGSVTILSVFGFFLEVDNEELVGTVLLKLVTDSEDEP